MKKIILVIFLNIIGVNCYSQIKMYSDDKKEDIAIQKYDSLKNYINEKDVDQYIGQTLFFYSQCNVYSKINTDYTYDSSNSHNANGKYFLVKDIIHQKNKYVDVYTDYLHLIEKDSKQSFYIESSKLNNLPLIIEGYFKKKQAQYIGKILLFPLSHIPYQLESKKSNFKTKYDYYLLKCEDVMIGKEFGVPDICIKFNTNDGGFVILEERYLFGAHSYSIIEWTDSVLLKLNNKYKNKVFYSKSSSSLDNASKYIVDSLSCAMVGTSYLDIDIHFKEEEITERAAYNYKTKDIDLFESNFTTIDPRKKYPNIKSWNLIKKRGVRMGMSKIEAKLSWGDPEDINTTRVHGIFSEQWVYPYNRYLYFSNGKLTAIQE